MDVFGLPISFPRVEPYERLLRDRASEELLWSYNNKEMLQHRKNGFHQRQQEYAEEDYNEYEVYEDEEEEEEEEEEVEEQEEEKKDPKSIKEEQDFLKMREKLKEQIRLKLKKQSAGALGRNSQTPIKRGTLTNDSFGSFFGPSQPSIAPRVIEESRSIRETKHIMANIASSSVDVMKKRDSISSGLKPLVNYQTPRQPKIVNEVKNKAQTLKDMRDYSFLLSDDADFPAPVTEPTKPKNTSAVASDGRSAHASLKGKIPSGKPTRPASSGNELKKPASSNQHIQNKVRPAKESTIAGPRPSSNDSRKDGNGVRNAPVRAAANISLKKKVPNQSMVTSKPSMNNTKAPAPPNMKKNLPLSKPPAQNHYSEQKRLPPQTDRGKTTTKHPTMKQPMLLSKAESSKQNPPRVVHNDRPNKKPAKRKTRDEEDVDDYRKAIREMFGYNPNKYAGVDEDVSDMEVGFDMIQKEERLSSKIAKKEDEEQLRLIEEEEERERRMRMKKKQKQR